MSFYVLSFVSPLAPRPRVSVRLMEVRVRVRVRVRDSLEEPYRSEK